MCRNRRLRVVNAMGSVTAVAQPGDPAQYWLDCEPEAEVGLIVVCLWAIDRLMLQVQGKGN